jgi:hypothetical protein
MKNGVTGAVLAGLVLVGGYAMFASNQQEPTPLHLNPLDASQNAYERTDNPTVTRDFLETGGPDRDCADFDTQSEAQDFFYANGGPSRDPHNLDRDGDGRVCETLP